MPTTESFHSTFQIFIPLVIPGNEVASLPMLICDLFPILQDVLKFGFSTREYVILTEKSRDQEEKEDSNDEK